MTRITPTSVEVDEQLQLVIEAAPNAMLIVNGDGDIVLANGEAARSFGYSPEELLQLRVDDLVPVARRGDHPRLRNRYFADPQRRGMGVGREIYGLRKDGTEIPIEIGLNPISIAGQTQVLASITDIAESLHAVADAELDRHTALVQSVLTTMPISVITTDRKGVIVSTNPAAEYLLGYPTGELVGHTLSEIDGVERTWGSEAMAWSPGDDQAERLYRRRDGKSVPVNEEVVVLRDDTGTERGYLAVAYDITPRIQSRQRLEHMRRHDSLTDLPNRTELLDRLDARFRRATDDGIQTTLLLLDLDHFKRVNDALGHDVGDHLLQRIAERLSRWARADDIVARLGGDEFVVVLAGVTPAVDLADRIASLTGLLLAPIEIRGHEVSVTASIGGAIFPIDGRGSATLLRHADVAMYRAKSSGRDSLRWFDESMLDDLDEKLALSGALRQALGHGELSVAYQPQYRLQDGRLTGFEALARWNSPTFGPISPERFIPVAEDSDLILTLGEWVMRRACSDISALEETLGVPLQLAVNISPRQLRGRNWPEQIIGTLSESGVSPERFSLEITEGILLEDQRDVIETMQTLRNLGIKIVIDDFGRGYSSLGYLTRFPVDKIKIDRSFVESIGEESEAGPVVDAIIAMAHALNMEVIAEGVETVEQEHYLRQQGCDQVQGFRYSRGVTLETAKSTPLDIAAMGADGRR